MKKKILVTGLLAVTSVFMFLSACGKKADNAASSAKTESSKVVVDNKPASSVDISSTVTPAGAIKPEYTSPLSGKALDKKYKNKRPFAFMFNNIEFAYPQTGTGRADILYEILAEGGITRLMGVFDYMKGDRIGSVRSA